MKIHYWKNVVAIGFVGVSALMLACGGGGGGSGDGFGAAALAVPGVAGSGTATAAVKIDVTGPNPVSYWNEVATNTINVAPAASGSAAEQRPISSVDLASVHLAIYDAMMAIVGTHRPYAAPLPAGIADADASQPAAVAAAARGVLAGLFPNRAAQYQAAYDIAVAGIAGGDARTRGLQIGEDAARAILALRADDGRSLALAPYVPGTTPGRFRGSNPINRFMPYVKPFSLASADQFRAVAPPALDSADYARDFEETRVMGASNSSVRTAAQFEVARFHTEPPPRFWPRNLRPFAMTDRSLAEHARLMALLFVAEADTEIACFESKYFHEFWRPASAIALADTDGNPATVADAAWTASVPTPNHPEYPAAHACVTGAVAEVLKSFFGTNRITFSFDSTVTSSTHTFGSTGALVDEVRDARIFGGMHFRSALRQGDVLGTRVARWIIEHDFQPR